MTPKARKRYALAPSLAADEAMKALWGRYERMSASPGTAAALLRMNAQVDVRHILSAIVEGARQLGVSVRAGVHTGECELRGEDFAGLAVHIGARVGGLAAAGEVLIPSTVRDLVAGSGLEFRDRGVHELRGVPGQWRLFAVA